MLWRRACIYSHASGKQQMHIIRNATELVIRYEHYIHHVNEFKTRVHTFIE